MIIIWQYDDHHIRILPWSSYEDIMTIMPIRNFTVNPCRYLLSCQLLSDVIAHHVMLAGQMRSGYQTCICIFHFCICIFHICMFVYFIFVCLYILYLYVCTFHINLYVCIFYFICWQDRWDLILFEFVYFIFVGCIFHICMFVYFTFVYSRIAQVMLAGQTRSESQFCRHRSCCQPASWAQNCKEMFSFEKILKKHIETKHARSLWWCWNMVSSRGLKVRHQNLFTRFCGTLNPLHFSSPCIMCATFSPALMLE